MNNKQGCIKIVVDPILHARTKYIEMCFYFNQEKTTW